jgi:glycogen synthase
MQILITADTVGGVWTYAQELVSGLLRRGHGVTLVSLGSLPSAEQTSWAKRLSGLDYRPTAYRLEWMQDSEKDVKDSSRYLRDLVAEVDPDVLHLNQYCYGDLSCDVPRIVVAHSDVVSWWVAVHGQEPESTSWMDWYRRTVEAGLQGAHFIVAPSQSMMNGLKQHYAFRSANTVIHNGRSPELFEPGCHKEDFALSVGRVWDKGKQVNILATGKKALPVYIAGYEDEPGSHSTQDTALKCMGAQTHQQLRDLYARAAMYVATSRYEPFGLAPVEAALSRCALLLNDIPTFRELWGDCACYFPSNDAQGLAEAIRFLHENPQVRWHFAELAHQRARDNFTAETMVRQYEDIYSSVAAAERVA